MTSFSIKKLIKSFGYAFNGLKLAIQNEQNLKIHIWVAIGTIALGIGLKISAIEFVIIFLCIGWVISLELLNSALEKLCDFIAPEYHQKIKWIKDVSAGAVLFAAIISFLIGLIIFITKIRILL